MEKRIVWLAQEAMVETLTNALEAANLEITNLKNKLVEVENNTALDFDRTLIYVMNENSYPRALFTGASVSRRNP